MTHATIAAKIHQSLDVHGELTTQVTLYDEFPDLVAKLFKLVVVQIFDLFSGRNTSLDTNLLCAWTADTIDSGQANYGVLMVGDINPCDTCHSLFLDQ